MKKNKCASQDFDIAKLPHNRWEVFCDRIKLRFGTLLCVGLILLLSLLPLLALSFYKDLFVNTIYASTLSSEQGAALIIAMRNRINLISVVAYGIASIGFAGAIRVVRQLVWDEPIFFVSDLVDGIKQNWATYLITFLLLGLMVFSVFFIGGIGNSSILKGFPFAFFVLLIFPITIFTLSQSAVYKNTFSQCVINSVSLYFHTVPKTLAFCILLLLFLPLTFIPNIFIKYVSIAVYIVLLAPMTLLANMLYNMSVFDKYIFSISYPDYVDKGLYRLKK